MNWNFKQTHEGVKRYKGHADRQVEQDSSDNAMVGNASGREYRMGNNPTKARP